MDRSDEEEARGESTADPPLPARRGWLWTQTLLYVFGTIMFFGGGGLFVWNRFIRPPGSEITRQVMPGLEASEKIEGQQGCLQDFNLLIVTFDTTRADHLECYGNRSVQTPHLNSLAKNGYLFANCSTVVPATLPSHTSMLTGLYPYSHGVRANGSFRLPEKVLTLQEVLKDKGYQTGAFISAYVLDSTFGLGQGFDHYDDDLTKGIKLSPQMFRERPAELTNEPAMQWLADHAADRFFCWVHYFDPHAAYLPPEPFRSEYEDDPYDGEIAYADTQLGRLLAHLDELGARDKTLIVMTADHGEGLGDHGEQTHAMLMYDSTMHIPLIISAPSVLPRGRMVERQVSIVDVMPTVLDLLGIDIPSDREGISLLTPAAAEPRICYIESLSPETLHGWAPLLGVKTLRQKYIFAPRPELYDLKADPGELENRYEQQPALVEQLHTALEQFVGGDLASAANVTSNLQMTPEITRKLAALGYVTTVGDDDDGGEEERIDPKDGILHWDRVQHGVHQRNAGDIAGAIETLEACLVEVPDDVWALQMLSGAYQFYGRYEDALALLQKAAGLAPNDVSLPMAMATTYASLGDSEQAKKLYHAALEIEPDYPPALLQLGHLALRARDEKRYLELTGRALELDRGLNKPSIHRSLGDYYLRRGELEKAREQYEQAIEVDALHGESHVGLAQLAIQEDNLDEAVRLLNKAIRFNPAQPRALAILGGVHSLQGRQAQAIRTLEHVLEMSPTMGPAYANLGLAHRRLGKLKEAETVYRKGLEVSANYDVLHQNLAQLLMQTDRRAEAMEHFQEAVRCNPYNAVALANLGVNQLIQDHPQAAARLLARAIRVDPKYAFAYTQLGIAFLRQQRVPPAMRLFARSLELDPQQSDAGRLRFMLEKFRSEGGQLPEKGPPDKLPQEVEDIDITSDDDEEETTSGHAPQESE